MKNTIGQMQFDSFIESIKNKALKEAVLERALTDKITNEIINQKISSQVNSINIGIKKINSKFNEKSKNYDIIKEEVLNVMTKYETSLKELGKFYDEKIEQLITRKLELQSKLGGLIAKKIVLKDFKKTNFKLKLTDKMKNVLKSSVNLAIKKLKFKNEDLKENSKEIEKKRLEQLNEKIKNVNEKIDKSDKEIYLITSEIKKLNERKKQALFDAMEVGGKWMVSTIRKPRTFEKITRFFSSKINTPKVIKKTILDPLNLRIEEFIENDLKNME